MENNKSKTAIVLGLVDVLNNRLGEMEFIVLAQDISGG